MSYYQYDGGRRGFMANVPKAVKNIIIINILISISTREVIPKKRIFFFFFLGISRNGCIVFYAFSNKLSEGIRR